MKENYDDSFIRWQKYTIEQFTYTSNIILSLSVASLGFLVNLLTKEYFRLSTSFSKYSYYLALLLFLLSISAAIILMINRLCDFRKTKDITKNRESSNQEEIDNLRIDTNNIGKRSWRLIKCQIFFFLFGILCTVVTVISCYKNILF